MNKKEFLKLIEKYPDDTDIFVQCNNCNHGQSGPNNIDINDNTNQTFGYIEIVLNPNWDKEECK